MVPARDQGDSSFGTFPGRLGRGGGLLPRGFPRRLHSASVFSPLDRWAEEASQRWFVMGTLFFGWEPTDGRTEGRGSFQDKVSGAASLFWGGGVGGVSRGFPCLGDDGEDVSS